MKGRGRGTSIIEPDKYSSCIIVPTSPTPSTPQSCSLLILTVSDHRVPHRHSPMPMPAQHHPHHQTLPTPFLPLHLHPLPTTGSSRLAATFPSQECAPTPSQPLHLLIPTHLPLRPILFLHPRSVMLLVGLIWAGDHLRHLVFQIKDSPLLLPPSLLLP
jgi:hypothetical protein